MLVIQLIETLGYCSLKGQFKEILLKRLGDKEDRLMEHMKYLIMLAVQKSDAQGVAPLQVLSSLVFCLLNLTRSEDYDLMVPSTTLKFNKEL